MRVVRQDIVAACCIAALLVPFAWIVGGLRAPDARGRHAWLPASLVVASSPLDTELYLPGCAIEAIVVQADGLDAAGRTVEAGVWRRGPSGEAAPLAAVRTTWDAHGRAVIPLDHSPRRERVLLRLTAVGAPVELAQSRPFELRRTTPSPMGMLDCAVDESRPAMAALLLVLSASLIGAGWIAGFLLTGGGGRVARTPHSGRAAAAGAALGMTSVLTYLLVVPPFEPPDELAHFQFARFVATTGSLPSAVPQPDSEWRASAYEWVQQPLYYLAAAAVLRVAGDASAAPAPVPHPQSRLTGGSDVNIYRHPDTTSPPSAQSSVWLLRWLSVAMAFGTLWCAARAVALATGDVRLGAVAAAAVGFVPQWGAVMGIVSTDPPATLAAAVALLLTFKVLQAPDDWRWSGGLGLVVGLACATKMTSVFLLPMLLVVVWYAGRERGPAAAARHAVWCGAGLLVGGLWAPLRAWIVFGDPLARAFKREVLAIGGFHVLDRPSVLSAAFVREMQTMVFEPFWARFGSLGAGPFPGSRLWAIYAAATVSLLVAFAVGATTARRAFTRGAPSPAAWMVLVSTIGVVTGVGLWAWVNLVPQADVVVHWTPRHILPLTAPLLVVVAAGVQRISARVRPERRWWVRAVLACGLLVLALAGLAVLRSVVLGFHFGY